VRVVKHREGGVVRRVVLLDDAAVEVVPVARFLSHLTDSNYTGSIRRRCPGCRPTFKTELELGHCLRTPAEGPCECDLVLTCSKFLTTSDYAPRLRARLAPEQQLIDDATARNWQREIERHTATQKRIEQLLEDLDR
jgi:hypothetical protein